MPSDRIKEKPETFDDWFSVLVERRLLDLHTALPGIIESFDASTQTAKVNLSINKVLKSGDEIKINPIINVPVQFPGGGGYHITFPIASGDECLVVFSERSIDNWQQYGGRQKPVDKRKHAYTDAFAIVGIHSKPNAVSNYSTNSLQIRNNDASTYINVTDSEIDLEINGGGATFSEDKSVTFANGAQITSDGDFVTASGISSDTHVHGGVSSGNSTTAVPQ